MFVGASSSAKYIEREHIKARIGISPHAVVIIIKFIYTRYPRQCLSKRKKTIITIIYTRPGIPAVAKKSKTYFQA